jgi:ribonuclease HII
MKYLSGMLAPYYLKDGIECGCDEAGRGCLAGPVVAAAVVLPSKITIEGLRDSKQLSEKQRNFLKTEIEQVALAFAVAFVSPQEIDDINILNASFLAMHRAIDQLDPLPDRILVDGNRFKPYQEIPHHTFVKGDDRYLSIAAASILAKTYRDSEMKKLHQEFPDYDWASNKGYPTKAHREALMSSGVTKYHRRSFTLYPGYKQGILFK